MNSVKIVIDKMRAPGTIIVDLDFATAKKQDLNPANNSWFVSHTREQE
jgi:hypothetical protein